MACEKEINSTAIGTPTNSDTFLMVKSDGSDFIKVTFAEMQNLLKIDPSTLALITTEPTTPFPSFYMYESDGTPKKMSYDVLRSLFLSKLYGTAYGDNVRIYTGVLRVSLSGTSGGGTVTWQLLDDTDHDIIGFTGVTTPNNQTVRLSFPAFKRVLCFHATPDETLNLKGVIAGASVGLDYLDLTISGRHSSRTAYTYNGTSWGVSISGLPFISTVANSGNNIVITSSLMPTANLNFNYGNIRVEYAGTNNRYIRYVTSGLGFNQTIVQLVDPLTGNSVAPDSNDKIICWNDNVNVQLSTQTITNATSYERYFYDGTGTTNFWVSVVGAIDVI